MSFTNALSLSLFLLKDDNVLIAEVEGGRGSLSVLHGKRYPHFKVADFPFCSPLIAQTLRSGVSSVVPDASTIGLYVQDRHVIQKGSRSILCVPVLILGKAAAVLYMENESVPRAFEVMVSNLFEQSGIWSRIFF